LKNGIAPIETVKEKITAIILNHRKQELVQEIGDSIYKKAIKNDEIKVYFEGE
jgi:hypothetical protein